MDKSFRDLALYEHRFWLQILGDHARFIKSSLSVKELKLIKTSEHFIRIFDNLLEEARKDIDPDGLSKLSHKSYCNAMEIRAFKLDIITKHLIGKIEINLPPTFLNHMVNEVEEYIRILGFLLQNQYDSMHPVHHHLIWLLDGVGHAAGIISSLDDIETAFKKIGIDFHERFIALDRKAIEMSGYLRTHLKEFPSLERLNQQADSTMQEFMKYLKDIKKLTINNKLLGTISPLLPDHMLREECYYLTKLSMVSSIKKPECDGTETRLSL